MQVLVTIPDELAAHVQARGLTPEGFVNKLLEEAIQAASKSPDTSARNMEAFFKVMTANSADLPPLPDEAFTRSSFYQGR